MRGSVAVIVALSIFVLLGVIGLGIDLGRLYVTRTELQNAADACALAAARELDGASDALLRAENAGLALGQRHRISFQREPVPIAPGSISFSAHLDREFQSRAIADPRTARYAMCTLGRGGIAMLFMQVVGIGDQRVSVRAVATLAPAQTTCALPVGLCRTPERSCPGGGTSWQGFCPGDWLTGLFTPASGNLTGDFKWLRFPEQDVRGARDIRDILAGPGYCDISAGAQVAGQPGFQQSSITQGWNLRFGLYSRSAGSQPWTTGTSDLTGYSYTPASWAAGRAAYSDYEQKRTSREPYQDADPLNILRGNSVTRLLTADLTAHGAAGRRLVTLPVVDCDSSGISLQTVRNWACVLMLHPFRQGGGGSSTPENIYVELVGNAQVAGSQCGSYGLAGGSAGPLVPVLVQ